MSKTNKKSLFGRISKSCHCKENYPDLWRDIFFFLTAAEWIFLCEYHDSGAEQRAETAGDYYCQH